MRNRMALSNGQKPIVHFSLLGLLPDGHRLACNRVLGTIALLTDEQNHPCMVAEEQFTSTEMRVLLPLLEHYQATSASAPPSYCPHEVLLAYWTHGHVTSDQVVHCREHLREAQETGIWDLEMRPIRNMVSRVRLKIRAFGLDVSSILNVGYMLMRV